MGIDKKRFKSDIQDVLICSLCNGVFEDPVMLIGSKVKCQHSFCRKCIDDVEDKGMCPNEGCGLAIGDGEWINNNTLEKLLSGLLLTCSFASLGCDQVVALSILPVHTGECLYNPDLTQACVGGCGMQLTKQQVSSHKCVEALKEEMIKIKGEMEKLTDVNQPVEKIKGAVDGVLKRIEKLTNQQAQSSQLMEKLEEENKQLKGNEIKLDLIENRLEGIENQLRKNEELESELKKCQTKVDELEIELELTKNNCNIPIGFIYVQLPKQSEPKSLFPNTEWSDVSEEYAGLFFRTVGDSSSQFGQVQDDASPRIVQMVSRSNSNDKQNIYTMKIFDANNDGTTRWTISDISGYFSQLNFGSGNLTGCKVDSGDYIYSRFLLSITEVRPKNTAVKIWKRIE